MTAQASSYIDSDKFNRFRREEGIPIGMQIKLAVFGNSLTLHGPATNIGWLGNHGMAASHEELDFVHLVMGTMKISSTQACIENCADLERSDAAGTWIEARTRDILARGPEVCIIQLGDNVLTEAQLSAFSKNLEELVTSATLTAARTLLLSTWWGSGAQDRVIESCAKRHGAEFIYIGDIYPHDENPDRKRRRFDHDGVHAHPGDWGMRKIAERVLDRLSTEGRKPEEPSRADPQIPKTLSAADFLFPSTLRRSVQTLRKLLLVGSCQADFYAKEFTRINRGLQVEQLPFNNLQRLPDLDTSTLQSFDLQYVQLPLRSVLTDAAIRFDPTIPASSFLELGRQNLRLMLDEATRYATDGLLTVVATFIVPQGTLCASTSDQHSAEDFRYIIQELNRVIFDYCRQHQNMVAADCDAIASSIGKMHFLDDPVYFFTHGVALDLEGFIAGEKALCGPAPNRLAGQVHELSITESRVADFFECIYRQIETLHRTFHQVDQVKLVIFDLDNTMWRGLIGEHYEDGSAWPTVHGWPTGVWDAVNQLRRRGILVSICSKNDEQLVRSRWTRAEPLGFVRFEDFICPKINWNSKAQNIADIMSSLSLTAKSVVFVDDNPSERDLVKSTFPDIRVIGEDPFAIKRLLTWSSETSLTRVTTESRGREESLRGRMARQTEQMHISREEFLQGLNTQIELFEVKDAESEHFPRVMELVNKTNQFNTTGLRRKIDDYHQLWAQGGTVYAFKVRDRYGDYGLVGVLFLLEGVITQFVMSCRVIGMDIEISVLRQLAAEHFDGRPEQSLSAFVIETESNTPCRKVYENAGFRATAHPQLFMLSQEDFSNSSNASDRRAVFSVSSERATASESVVLEG